MLLYGSVVTRESSERLVLGLFLSAGATSIPAAKYELSLIWFQLDHYHRHSSLLLLIISKCHLTEVFSFSSRRYFENASRANLLGKGKNISACESLSSSYLARNKRGNYYVRDKTRVPMYGDNCFTSCCGYELIMGESDGNPASSNLNFTSKIIKSSINQSTSQSKYFYGATIIMSMTSGDGAPNPNRIG